MTEGHPPNDRGCRACGKIGHLVADCPRKKASDNRKKESREAKERERLKQTVDKEKVNGKGNKNRILNIYRVSQKNCSILFELVEKWGHFCWDIL